MSNFVTKVLDAGGSIHPLIVPEELGTKGTGLFNPSVYNDGGLLMVNIRHCQYTIYHAEKGKFEHQWGPLVYLCPENDMTLTTTNWLGVVNPKDFSVQHRNVDFSTFNKPPLWEFVGLEDCRLFRWDGKLYLCGVRRDTTTNGQGRMELSEIKMEGVWGAKEISRFRIPSTGSNTSYCEKNWMPILDMPYHFIKWCNPTEVVKVDIEKGTTEQVFVGDYIQRPFDLRGGSQVIPFGKYRIAIVHVLTKFFKTEAGRKNAQYRHRFIVWDNNWNVVKLGDEFDFMGGEIEFCCGMAEYEGKFMITFGFQDNAAYILETPRSVIEEMVNG